MFTHSDASAMWVTLPFSPYRCPPLCLRSLGQRPLLFLSPLQCYRPWWQQDQALTKRNKFRSTQPWTADNVKQWSPYDLQRCSPLEYDMMYSSCHTKLYFIYHAVLEYSFVTQHLYFTYIQWPLQLLLLTYNACSSAFHTVLHSQLYECL